MRVRGHVDHAGRALADLGEVGVASARIAGVDDHLKRVAELLVAQLGVVVAAVAS